MLSMRSFARSAPRAISRLASSSVKRSTASSFLQSSRTQYAATFSTSIKRSKAEGYADSSIQRSKAQGDGEQVDGELVDGQLVAKLDSELKTEEEITAEIDTKTSIKDYLQNGPFEVIDIPGRDDVILKRTFGKEKIQITFQASDLNMPDPEDVDELQRTMGMPDEENDGEEHDGEEHDGKEDDGYPAEVGEGEDEGPRGPEVPSVGLRIIIEKPGKGALLFEAMAEDGNILVDTVRYIGNAAHAYDETPQATHEKSLLFAGPPFESLDEDLKPLLERYLDERGINSALAIFVPDYMEMKEQKEYLKWLSDVKGFIAA